MQDIPTVAAYDPAEVSSNTTPPTASDGFFVQLGAFKSEQNSYKLIDRLAGFNAGDNARIFQEHAGDIYRVKLGPYSSRSAAEQAKAQVQQQYGIKGLVQ